MRAGWPPRGASVRRRTRRCAAVDRQQAHLVPRGAGARAVEVERGARDRGVGSIGPVATNATEEDRAKNRRLELLVRA